PRAVGPCAGNVARSDRAVARKLAGAGGGGGLSGRRAEPAWGLGAHGYDALRPRAAPFAPPDHASPPPPPGHPRRLGRGALRAADSAALVFALGRRLGANRRRPVRTVCRGPHCRSDQAGLSHHTGAARTAAAGAGAQAGADPLAWRDRDTLNASATDHTMSKERGSQRGNQRGMTINCDMGEGFGLYRLGNDAALMPHIDLANVACGFHASDPSIMHETVRLAKQHGVKVGAHPSLPD